MSELLLIDDDQELCELLTSWLSQEGFQVRACHDGFSARKALADTAPAAVVLDVMLPDGSGLELLKQLRNDHPELPVLMLSARGAAWSASMNRSSPSPSPKAACSKRCCANPASPWTNRNWRRSPWAAS